MTLHTGRFNALALAALLFMLVSCEGEKPSHALASNGKGKVMLSLYSDIEIRSEASPISDVDDYNFRFVGVDGYATSEYYRYGDVSWPMEWYFGLFRLEAESCTETEAEEGYGRLRYAGIGQPFKVLQQYINSIGYEVELLTTEGKKMKGALTSADENGFVVTIEEKQKLEGKKRPQIVEVDKTFGYADVKWVKNIIDFK